MGIACGAAVVGLVTFITGVAGLLERREYGDPRSLEGKRPLTPELDALMNAGGRQAFSRAGATYPIQFCAAGLALMVGAGIYIILQVS